MLLCDGFEIISIIDSTLQYFQKMVTLLDLGSDALQTNAPPNAHRKMLWKKCSPKQNAPTQNALPQKMLPEKKMLSSPTL